MKSHTAALTAGTLAVLMSAGTAFALPVGAQPRINAQAGLRVGATTTEARAEARAQILGEREAKAKARGAAEIDRRIAKLTELNAKVQSMLKVSDAGKSAIDATAQAQIAALTDLKARIESAGSTTTLKADMQSITKSYRIFALIIPQGHITVTADKIHTAIDSMNAVIGKLQGRISSVTGTDTSALAAKITDAQTQLVTAGADADAAVSLTANLQPDEGDKATMDANKKALQDARTKIQSALKALDAARKDLKDVASGLKQMNAGANAAASTTATQ